MTSRRALLHQLAALAGTGASLLLVGACEPRLPLPGVGSTTTRLRRIGYLSSGAADDPVGDPGPLREGLRDLGYRESRDFVIEARFAGAAPERLPALAVELIQLPVDVLVTAASPAALAAKQATSTLPVIFTLVNDPVAQGLVDNLARPGGNVTGLSTLSGTISGKRVELMHATLPDRSRLAVVWNTTNPGMALALEQTRAGAEALGLEVQALGVRPDDDLARAFDAAVERQADAVVILPTIALEAVDLAARHRLPAIYSERTFVDSGGLMGLGPNYASIRRRAATYVDKVLRGSRPAELPVEQPSTFDFVVNLRTARELGLALPERVLLQATDVLP